MFSPSALAIDFSDCGGGFACPYVTYGDGNSYSLPVNALLYDIYQGGGTGPGNPYYVTSTPGAIKDLVVVGTGASGGPVNTNFAGMDNAYPTPNADSGGNFFTTNKDAYGGSQAACNAISSPTVTCAAPADPGGVAEFTGDGGNTWDVRLTAMQSFLGGPGKAPIFFFNNNQINSGDAEDQNLAIWARVSLYDDAGGVGPLHLYFTNLGGKYGLVSEGGGGVLNGTAGTGTLGGAGVSPLAGDNDETDYVLSGGALCYDGFLTIVSCNAPTKFGGPINHNLGANQAVYAVVFPALDAIITTAGFGGYDYLQIDWRMGCDPNTDNPAVTCEGVGGDTPNHGRFLNNGYEQLFIATYDTVFVPVPSSIALLGLGLIGLAAFARRRKVTQ